MPGISVRSTVLPLSRDEYVAASRPTRVGRSVLVLALPPSALTAEMCSSGR